jgi:hypothetical protein
MQIHFFNPDHDIALALNQRRFATPHVGRQMRSDLGYIPALWAEDGDVVVVEDIDAAELLYKRHKLTSRARVEFVTTEQLENTVSGDGYRFAPWGWNKSIRSTFLDAKIPKTMLPSEQQLDSIRMLSNRALAVKLLSSMKGMQGVIGLSAVCNSSEEVKETLKLHKDIVVKAPWSSSGRGVRYINVDDGPNENVQKWINNTLEKQGSIIVEKKCRKIQDFAMEFQAKADGKVVYDGLSLFTTKNGAYTGNILLPEDEKEEYLHRYLSPTLLDEVKKQIETFLTKEINGAYLGPLGVDMMICSPWEEGTSAVVLNPCIEINMRRTMGHVALALTRRGQRGIMSIDYDGKNYRLHIRQ